MTTDLRCPSCNTALSGHEFFCPICGQRLRAVGEETPLDPVCRLCGAELPDPKAVCVVCGYDLNDRRVVVLIVDDNLDVVEMLQDVLESAGYHAVHCWGGEAVAVASVRRPDVIILDLLMPDVHGAEVLATLKSTPATADIPVLISSAGIRLRLMGASHLADGQVEKPFDVADLLSEIDRVTMSGTAR